MEDKVLCILYSLYTGRVWLKCTDTIFVSFALYLVQSRPKLMAYSGFQLRNLSLNPTSGPWQLWNMALDTDFGPWLWIPALDIPVILQVRICKVKYLCTENIFFTVDLIIKIICVCCNVCKLRPTNKVISGSTLQDTAITDNLIMLGALNISFY